MLIRKSILKFCDISISLISRFRKVFALTKKDIKVPDILVRTVFPYDVVVTKDLFQAYNEGTASTYCEPGEVYTYGVVIGYKNLDKNGNPDKVQVAYFNTAEYSVPEIKMHNAEDLVVNFSPLRSAMVSKSIVDEMYSQLENVETTPPLKHSILGDEDDDGGGNTGNGNGEIFH